MSYQPFSLDLVPTDEIVGRMSVSAGLALAINPRSVKARGRIEFRGRLRGAPGQAGTQVVIYAVGNRTRDRIPVATVRADATGRFAYRYRFQRSAPGTRYRFVATMQAQRSYPYASGSSPSVTVRIR